ncbi:MAG: hypothetical protein LBE91_08200 [Tannerella sp.]|jgi:hypothetical protein|nr:hypothetical protein [Tannerella sp.]
MNNLIRNYNKAKQAIYDHVGFRKDWVIYPIDDCTDCWWQIIGDEKDGSVVYAETRKDIEESTDEYWQDDIYTQRFYKKWVYRGEKFTMIFCDSGVDGMKYFRVFDNKLELK